jgi:hypothetical protein
VSWIAALARPEFDFLEEAHGGRKNPRCALMFDYIPACGMRYLGCDEAGSHY